jgi:three-Cys-motif partner protein
MLVPANYHGREQAFVKHRLLETYLQTLFMIIGMNQRSIRYVDCFSGPWQEGSAELQDTSIGIVLKIFQKSQEGLKKLGREVTFHALFIEKDTSAFQKLQSHLSGFSRAGIFTDALHGDFFELRDSMLKWCGPDDFTFFFVDPKGWKNVVEIPNAHPAFAAA